MDHVRISPPSRLILPHRSTIVLQHAASARSTLNQLRHLPAMCMIQQTDMVIERTRAILKQIAALTAKEMQNKMATITQQSTQRHPFALMNYVSLPERSPSLPAPLALGAAPIASLPERRPRQSRRLSYSASLLSRLAARGALPRCPSQLETIIEGDESVDLNTANFHSLTRPPSPVAADCGDSSRKRRAPELDAPPDALTQIWLAKHHMPVESLEPALAPDAPARWRVQEAPAHWKRRRAMGAA